MWDTEILCANRSYKDEQLLNVTIYGGKNYNHGRQLKVIFFVPRFRRFVASPEARVHAQVRQCGICGHSSTGVGFSPSSSVSIIPPELHTHISSGG
jgi:hypothetical protein